MVLAGAISEEAVMKVVVDVEPPPCSGPNNVCEPLDLGEWKFWTELDGTGTAFFYVPGAESERLLERA
jgi:hypothetical protein